MRVAAFIRICGTSGKIIQYGCRDAPCEKSWKQGRNPLSNTIKDTSTIMRNPMPENRGNKEEIPLTILSRILAQSCVTPPYMVQA